MIFERTEKIFHAARILNGRCDFALQGICECVPSNAGRRTTAEGYQGFDRFVLAVARFVAESDD